MNCKKLCKMLPDFIDGLLSPEEEQLIKKHLSQCKACASELKAIKKYKEQFNQLNKIQAPEDFLEKVHTKLTNTKELKSFWQKLFSPFIIKVPLEAVGAIAIAIFIVMIFIPKEKNFQEKIVEQPTKIYPSETHFDDKLTQRTKLRELNKKDLRVFDLEKPAGNVLTTQIKGQIKSINLVLQIEHYTPPAPESKLKEENSQQNDMFLAKSGRSESMPSEKKESENGQIPQNYNEEQAPAKPIPTNEVIDNIKKIIAQVNGQITIHSNKISDEKAQKLIVTIPANNNSTFLTNLNRIGKLKYTTPLISATTNYFIQYQILIEYLK